MTDDTGSTEQASVINPAPQAEPPTSGKAITSLVLGIVSMPSCVCVGLPAILLGLGAIIFAILAKKDVAAGRAGGASNGLAIGGLACGIIGLLLGLVNVVIIVIGMIAEAGNQGGSPYGP